MSEADEGHDLAPIDLPRDAGPLPPIELGGPVQERALPDHGRLVIKREGVVLEGSMPALALGVGVAGTVACAGLAEQATAGPLPTLCGMASILAQSVIYFRATTGHPRIKNRRRGRMRKGQKRTGKSEPTPKSLLKSDRGRA